MTIIEIEKNLIALTRAEWANEIMEAGDRMGDPNYIKKLIARYKMNKKYDLN